MPRIIPIRELRDTNAISEMCHNSEEPVFITKNGYGDMVIMSVETFEKSSGMSDFYSDIKLDDSMFEVMLCSLHKKRDILKAILTLKTSDISYVSGIELYKAHEMEIIFKDKDKPWCIDGEEFDSKTNRYLIKLKSGVKMMIPKKNIDKLFIKQ